ncbi:hypothetical protein A1Q1_00476 [Trichosporon asahii var. asahii CBS 2479]|uniref:Uncharacterized protein n=1 Tax=Trichosporon asahii var. asahii (strain ATCC 90039 / CBS 2479 / JCM 2466 / KCTC 7840 / NBRC 103889/ NCYC 2677 / UAMH 7654) TaxID=1186058 RepID=J4UFT5_TRIAS|nr:hypothetical protein A1Q1_00476 [Trichosporon asahii var. asahii CBS 2479]EJT50260.1 hypothetical protein A1Q1_00476 [Trichosporon asahii var. asahii CBS 2479]
MPTAAAEIEVDVQLYQTFAAQLGLETRTNLLLREWYRHEVGCEPSTPMPYTEGVTSADTCPSVEASDDLKSKLYDKVQSLWHLQVERNRLDAEGFVHRFGYEPRTPLPYTEAGVGENVEAKDAVALLTGVHTALASSWFLQVEKNRLLREAFVVQFAADPASPMPYTDNGTVDENAPTTSEEDAVAALHDAIGQRLGLLVRLHDEWGALFSETFAMQNGQQLPPLST